MQGHGKPIDLAESPAILLESIAQCVGGHISLYEVGSLHRDISLDNLLINKDHSGPLWLGFLIDLDLAIDISREGAAGAAGRTSKRAFMAIGVLLGEPHSFMHHVESFFWVLFWIRIHYLDPKSSRTLVRFETHQTLWSCPRQNWVL
ncbi:hypothetical protein V8C37DRAFT_171677 [Trichoderma ceciliae]